MIKKPKPVQYRAKLNPVQRLAYTAYTNQKSKCYNKNNPDYKYYGGRGIEVKYSKDEFMEWYQEQSKDYVGNQQATIGRIDHDGHYAFNNIELVPWSENSHERYRRKGRPQGRKEKMIGLFSKTSHDCVAVFSSINSCAKYFDLDASSLLRSCQIKKTRGSQKYSWYYRFCDQYGNILK